MTYCPNIGGNYKEGRERQVVLRLVSYYHPDRDRAYYFLTNLFDLPPERIAHLYKQRWRIEPPFKKIKQNFPLRYFYGDNRNAIQVQIWCTLIALLLITIMKRALTRPWSFSDLVSLLQKHLFTYARFTDFFDNVEGFARDFVKNRGDPEEFQGKLDFYGTSK